MDAKEFIARNTGKDKLRGRPIRLNRQSLSVKDGKDYAELMLIGDVHLGYPTCELAKFVAMLDYALKNNIKVLLMGDLLESGLRDSVGDSIYRQKLNPQEQMETMIEILQPLADAGLIIGLHVGNHESRIAKSTGINIGKVMAKILNVRYLGYSCWSLLSIDGMRYSLFSTHGSGGSRFKHTKLKRVVDMCGWINSDILAMGHMHSLVSEAIIKQYFDHKKNKIMEVKQYVIITGSFLGWDESYGQDAGYPISKIGSPKLKLFANKKDVHVSF